MTPDLTRLDAWRDAICAQQDYLWFVAIALSCALLFAWWQQPRRSELAWLAWGAGTTVVHCIAGIAAFVSPFIERSKPVPGAPAPHLMVDLIMGGTAAVLAAAWWWHFSSSLARRAGLRWIGVLLLASLGWLRRDHVVGASWILAAALTVLAVRGWRRPRSSWFAVAATLLALAAWLSSWGPWAAATQELQRWNEWNALNIVCPVFLAGAQLAALVGIAQTIAASKSPEQRAELHTLLRPFVLAAAGWLVAGLGMAAIAGRQARTSFEAAALSRVTMAAALMDTAGLEDALGPKFLPTETETSTTLSGKKLTYFYAESVTDEKVAASTAQIHNFFLLNPDLSYVGIATPRQGHLFFAIPMVKARGFSGIVYSLHALRSEDLEHWSRREPYFETGISNRGTAFVARAPLRSASGRQLGWLQFDFSIGLWAATQAQARLLTFVVVAMGFALLTLLFVRQLRRRERESALRAAAEAETANRLKTVFLANVSHELRTPIQSVLGFAELLHGSLRGEVERARLASLRQHGELMIRLVNDLIDLGMLDCGKFRLVEKTFDLKRLVGEVVESLAPRAAAKGLKLRCHIDDQVPTWVVSDPERLRQILLNLVGNAVKFTERGRVDVVLAQPHETDGLHHVSLVVRDTGPGIPVEQQRQLFEPFSRLPNSARHEGSGLGLALTAGLCQRLGDGLALESDGLSGSLFRTTLRLRGSAAPVLPQKVESGAFVGWRILVADDNPFVRDLFASFLTDLGAECVTAATGSAAIAQAAGEGVRAIVLDLAMPGMDGNEAARQIRAAGGRQRIVGVSAHASGAERASALAAGMDEFLSKPVELSALASALQPAVEIPAHIDPWTIRRAEWEQGFRAEIADRLSALASSLEQRAWVLLQQRAHHLKNSAMVIQDDALFHACDELEQAAEAADSVRARTAWTAVLRCAGRWTSALHEFRPD